MAFPPTFVINLKERKDRWIHVQQSFQGWPLINLERIEAVRDFPGWKGCFRSHQKAISLAKERGYPWVLVLEDDCEAVAESSAKFSFLLPILWEKRNQWEIFNGGPTFVEEIEKVPWPTPLPLFFVKGLTTHFVLYNESVYNKILNLPLTQELDVIFKNSFKTIATFPHIAIQYVNKSDITNDISDYNTIFSESKKKLANAI